MISAPEEKKKDSRMTRLVVFGSCLGYLAIMILLVLQVKVELSLVAISNLQQVVLKIILFPLDHLEKKK